MEIPWFVLVLQIGLNAALNNRGYNGNPLIPSARFLNSGQTRRLPDSDSFVPLSSRGIPASDSEQSDDDYSSFEDYSFRSVWPNQRQNDYLRYNTGPENDVSVESAPFGRINSSNFVDSLQSSSSLSRRTDPNFRRPYLRNGLSNLRQSPTRNYYRKVNDDLTLEGSSVESSNPEDASRLGEEASYLRSLLSLIEQPNNRRRQNRKYYRKANSLSRDVSPIDILDPGEEAVNGLLNSLNRRRHYRNKHQYDLPTSRIHEPSPVKDIPDAYIDNILLVTDDDKPDEIPLGRPKLGSPEQTGLVYNNLYNRKHGDGHNLDDDIFNHLSPFRGLRTRLRSRKITNDSPLCRKFNRKGNDNAGLESSLNGELFPDDDKTGQLTLLRLASLENLNLDSTLLRSGDRKNHSNRKSGRRNFLRLSLSPNNNLTLDEGVASDISELLSETLDKLNLVPVTLIRTGPLNNQYSRMENNKLSAEEDNHSNNPVLRLNEIVDIPNSELPVRRYHEFSNRSKNSNRKRGNNIEALKKLLNDNSVKNRIPYHEVKSKAKLPSISRNEKLINNRRDDFSDEFSLDTLFNFRNVDHDYRLDSDDNFSSDLSALRSTNQKHLSLEPPLLRSSDENPPKSKDTDDTLHLEFPWNGTLSSDNEKRSNVTALRSKSELRNSTEKDNVKDTTDVLHLEFPWNDALSSENGNKSKLFALRSKSQFNQSRNSKEKDNTKNTSDILHLEFPWDDVLSPDENETGELKSQSLLRSKSDSRQDREPKDELRLEFPWNDKPSPDNPSSKRTAVRTPDPFYVHPYLRNRNIKKHPNYFRRSYDKFTEGIRLQKLKDSPSESRLRHSNRRFSNNQSLGVLPLAREDLENDTVLRDTDEDPSAVVTFPI